MLKFIQQVMDWWHDRPPGADRHDFVEPPIVAVIEPARSMGKTAKLELAVADAVEKGMVVYRDRPPTLEEALAIVREHFYVRSKAEGTFEGEHRGRSFTAAPNASDAARMAPPDLNEIVRQLKELGAPFLMICLHREALWKGAVHGWCNGSNFGRQVIEELTRCAELNIKQELAKCGEFGAGRQPYSGPPGYMEGSGYKPTKYLK